MPGYGNNQLFLQTLQSLGVAPETAVGAMGSLGWESGMTLNNKARNPGDGSDGSDSIGWGQWNGPRARNLIATGQRMGLDWHDPRVQAQHIKQELTGPYAHVLQQLKAAGSDIGAGARIWTGAYEVPAVNNWQDRAKRGVQQAQAMGMPVNTTITADMLARSAGAPGQQPAPSGDLDMGALLAQASAPPPGVDMAALDGLGDSSSSFAGLGGAPPAASGGLGLEVQPDDQVLPPAEPAVLPAGPSADELGARYQQAKLQGGPVAGGLADLFKIKDVGQAKQLRRSRVA
jgi:hypothetical protein